MMNSSSVELNNILSKDVKKDYGIFFTPQSIIEDFYPKVISYLPQKSNYTFLEPSCGSCEFIDALQKDSQFKNKNNYTCDAIEHNSTIFENISQIKRKNVNYIHHDFLYYDLEHKKDYDMIIGNPPYFVVKSNKVPNHFKGKKKDKSDVYYDGRIQIFVLFILHSLAKLKNDGVLGFILPKSVLNSAYYMKTRKYIYDHFELVEVIDYGNMTFDDTSQETVGIIIKKNQVKNNKYVFQRGENIFFTYQKSQLEECYQNSTTLSEAGFLVKTGTVVWNEHKEKMSDDPNHSLLLYNSNVEKNQVNIKTFSNDEKKQYIQFEEKIEKVPFIVCNRGHGNSKYKLNYAYIDEKLLESLNVKSVCVENHLNIIYYNGTVDEKVRKKMKYICEKLCEDEKIQKWCELFLGNNGFSKTELESYFPISFDL